MTSRVEPRLALPKSSIDWARLVAGPILGAYFAALIVLGAFDDFHAWSALHYTLLALLAALAAQDLIAWPEERGRSRRRFRVSVWALLGVRVAIQATGAAASPLYPLAYLVFAALSGLVGPLAALLLWALLAGLEAGWMAASGPGDWLVAAEHGACFAGFGVVVGALIRLERKGRREASLALDRIAGEVEEFQRDDTVQRLSGLSEGGRRIEDLRSAFTLDQSFRHALDSGRETLAADTLALFWRGASPDRFYLRERSSLRAVATQAEFGPDGGLLGQARARRAVARGSGAARIGRLPYYPGKLAAQAAVVAPLCEGEAVVGLLVADRVDGPEFGPADEKLIASLAGRLHELHGHALGARRAQAQAERFKSLAELSRRLSRTLDLDAILESSLRAARVIAEPVATAVVLKYGDRDPEVAAVDGLLPASLKGQIIDLTTSLVGRTIAAKETAARADLDRDPAGLPVLGPDLDPPGTRSVFIHPLPLPNSSIGAIAFFGAQADAFSGYAIKAAEVLADMTAVAVHNALLYREMETRALTDGLTGLANHRAFEDRLEQDLERAGRLGTRLAVVLADIDHFKQVNDRHGHPVGDEVLKGVAAALAAAIRKADSAARYGGEEFVLILTGADAVGAVQLCERARKRVAKLRFAGADGDFGVSVSLGVSVFPDHGRDPFELVELADRALYRAKRGGRNRTAIAHYGEDDD